MGGQSPRLLSAEEHVLDRAFGQPRRRSDTASDSAAVCPHAPTPAVTLGIDPSMVGATPRHHEPDASDRVNLPLPLQPPASGRLWLLKGTDGPAWRLRWLGHRGAIRPRDRYRTRCGGTGRWLGTVALQAVIAACRWRRHGLDFTAWLTSEATQDPGKVEICPVRTTDALAPVSGSRQLACGVARARQETNSDISLLCRGPGSAQPPTWMSARNQLPRHPATRHTNLTLNSAALHRPIGPPQPVELRRQRPGAVLHILQVAVAVERPAVDAARPAAPVAGLRGARTGVVAPGPAGAPAALAEHTQLAAVVLGEKVPVDLAREAVSDVGVAGADLGRRHAARLRGALQRRGALRGDRR